MRRFNDGVVQSRVDKRDLATAYNYLHSKGVYSRSVSELVRNVLEEFVEILCANSLAKFIEDSGEARSVLSVVYGDEGLNPGRRGRGNEYKNLNLDSVSHAPRLVDNDSGLAKMVNKAVEMDRMLQERKGNKVDDGYSEKTEEVLGKTGEKFERPTHQVVERPEGWNEKEIKYLLTTQELLKKIEKDKEKDSNIPRQKSPVEMDLEEERIREKDEAYAKALKSM